MSLTKEEFKACAAQLAERADDPFYVVRFLDEKPADKGIIVARTGPVATVTLSRDEVVAGLAAHDRELARLAASLFDAEDSIKRHVSSRRDGRPR